MTKRVSHTSMFLAGALCLGGFAASNAKAAPVRPSQSVTLSAASQVAPDVSITDVYWANRHGRRYWVQPHRGRYYR